VAELLAAPVAKALLGKAVLADDDPYTNGGIGILGTAPSQTIMEQCDAVLIVGSTFPLHRILSEAGCRARRSGR
jgi:pyruvate dehydrogenase (quinone)